jgi:hypothetical protein
MISKQPISIWTLKPWWCQPWSIILTGITLIGGSWWLWHLRWVTIGVAIPVLVWMGFFLLIYPALIMAADAQLEGQSEGTRSDQPNQHSVSNMDKESQQ